MMKKVPNRSLLTRKNTSQPQPQPQPQPTGDFCPIGPRGTSLNEAERLIVRYRKLVEEIRAIRGKLYRVGIDPEKYK